MFTNGNCKIPAARQQFSVRGSSSVTARPRSLEGTYKVAVVRVASVYWTVLPVRCVSVAAVVVVAIIIGLKSSRHPVLGSTRVSAWWNMTLRNVHAFSTNVKSALSYLQNFNLFLTQVRKLVIKPNVCNVLRKQSGYLSYIIHKRNLQ
jgi:hypothetical protein